MKDLNRNLEDLNRNMKDPPGSCFRSPANIVVLHYGIILKDPLRFLKVINFTVSEIKMTAQRFKNDIS